MAETYITKQGDMLDQIAWDYYKRKIKWKYGKDIVLRSRYYKTLMRGYVSRIYDANHGIEVHGVVLPEGLEITLPDIEQPATETIVRVWGGEA